jgi:hypothetical protein
MGDTGAAAVPALTIIETFMNTVQKHGHRSAIAQKKKINVRKIFTYFLVSSLSSLLGCSRERMEDLDLARVLE